jgi:hypothetical protein
MSSALSITIRPTPAASASPMSRSLLASPCRRTCCGSNPAASHRELARGGDVAAEPLAREDAQDGRAGQRLGGEVHVGGRVAGAKLVAVLARAVAQAPLVEDEGGCPELGGDVGEGASADE